MSVWRDKKTGKWRYKFEYLGERKEQKGFATRLEAQEAELNVRKRLQAPILETQRYSLSLKEVAVKYLIDCRARMQKNTWRAKASYYDRFLEWLKNDDITMQEISTGQLNEYLLYIQVNEGNKNANRHLKDLKALWNWASRQEQYNISKNPCKFIEPFPEDPFVKYVPPFEDIYKVLMVANSEQMEIIKAVFHSWGGRIGEVLRLKWEDVNFEKEYIVLWTRKRKRGEWRAIKKPMDEGSTLFELMQHKWKNRNKESEFVFTNPRTGKPYGIRPRWMKELCEKAEVKPFEFHSIRHRVAAMLDDSGKATLRQIRDLLGHERISTTDNYLKSVAHLRGLSDVLEQKGESHGHRWSPIVNSEEPGKED